MLAARGPVSAAMGGAGVAEDNGPMGSIVYVDRSEILTGKLPALEAAVRELAGHVAAHAPRVRSYAVHVSPDRSTMTVVHVHADAGSLEELMEAIAPLLPPFSELLRLRAIDVYGAPSERTRAALEAKVALLGGTVTVHDAMAAVEPAASGVVGGEGFEPPTSSV